MRETIEQGYLIRDHGNGTVERIRISDPVESVPARITRDELARRLGPRRVAIAQAATYGHPAFDPDVAAFVTLLQMQDLVELDAAELNAGLALLEAKGITTPSDTARAKAGRS